MSYNQFKEIQKDDLTATEYIEKRKIKNFDPQVQEILRHIIKRYKLVPVEIMAEILAISKTSIINTLGRETRKRNASRIHSPTD